jgi:hypothetical protein
MSYLSWVLLGALPWVPSIARADLILETATPGPPPTTAIGVGGIQWLGARLTIAQTVLVDHIGCNLSGAGTVFGAIVPLSGLTGLPPSPPDQIVSYALAGTSFNAPGTLSDVSVPLSLTLGPGSYGVVFGIGLFGSSGGANLSTNNVATSQASFFAMDPAGPNNSLIWLDRPDLNATPLRIFVTGTRIVPEPSSLIMASLGLLSLAVVAPRRLRRTAQACVARPIPNSAIGAGSGTDRR